MLKLTLSLNADIDSILILQKFKRKKQTYQWPQEKRFEMIYCHLLIFKIQLISLVNFFEMWTYQIHIFLQ